MYMTNVLRQDDVIISRLLSSSTYHGLFRDFLNSSLSENTTVGFGGTNVFKWHDLMRVGAYVVERNT